MCGRKIVLILENSSSIAPLTAATNFVRIFHFNNVDSSQSGKRLSCDCCRIWENEPAKGKNLTFTSLRRTVTYFISAEMCKNNRPLLSVEIRNSLWSLSTVMVFIFHYWWLNIKAQYSWLLSIWGRKWLLIWEELKAEEIWKSYGLLQVYISWWPPQNRIYEGSTCYKSGRSRGRYLV